MLAIIIILSATLLISVSCNIAEAILLNKSMEIIQKQDERVDSINEFLQFVVEDLRGVQDMIKNHELIDLESKRILNDKMEKCIKELNIETP